MLFVCTSFSVQGYPAGTNELTGCSQMWKACMVEQKKTVTSLGATWKTTTPTFTVDCCKNTVLTTSTTAMIDKAQSTVARDARGDVMSGDMTPLSCYHLLLQWQSFLCSMLMMTTVQTSSVEEPLWHAMESSGRIYQEFFVCCPLVYFGQKALDSFIYYRLSSLTKK